MGVNVLGPLSLDGNADRIAPRDRMVLAVLAMHPHEAVSADRLADALWGGSPPATWHKVVQGCVVRIRRLLGPESVATTDHGYVLTLPDEEIDAVRFERLVRRGEELLSLGEPERARFTLTQALGLWHGTAFTDLGHWEPGAAAAGHLEELHHDAEELRVEASLRAGAWREVLPEAAALVTAQPLREARWGLLARAQYQAGRQAEALSTLRRARTVLVGELGLDPGPDLVSLERAILDQDPSLTPRSADSASSVCPYRGLLPYGIDQAEDFFGRDGDIEAGHTILGREGVLVVVGPSGAGKSSLVRAGIAAAAQRDGDDVAVISPGADPVAALTDSGVIRTSRTLVVDQVEELVTVCRDVGQRTAFLDAVVGRAASGAAVVAALRADRLGELTEHRHFARLVERGLYLLAPMSEPDLRSAIEGPARRAGLLLEPGLVDLLVQEVSHGPGALPLLSHALAQTWRRREGRTLTVAGYRTAGGIRGAVSRTAENVYQSLDPGQQQGLRELLLRLVTSTDDHAVRSPLPRRVIPGGSPWESLVETLVAARLVTSDGEVVELAHESLIAAWPRLRSWLDEDVEGQRTLRHLTVASDSWEAMGRPPSELYRGTRLVRALEWREGTSAELTPTEQAFLDAGEALADEESRSAEVRLREQRRANRRLRLALGGVAAVLVVALGAGAVALREGRRADAQALVAQVRELSAASRAAAESDPQLAILLALEAARLSEGGTEAPEREALEALHTAVTASRIDLVVPGLGGPAAWSPDGEVFVTEGPEDSGLVDVRSAEDGVSVLSFVGHELDVNDVSFGPDGLLATTGDDGALRVWDADGGRLVAEVLGTEAVRGPSFAAASGRVSAAWTDEGVVRVVDADTGGDVVEIVLPDGPAWTSLSPDGRSVAVSTYGRTEARVYDARTGSLEYLIRDPGRSGSGPVSYSPDGEWLATAGEDAVVRIRDARTGEPLHVLDQMVTIAPSLAWSPDSRRLAAGGVDGTVHVFDVTTDGAEPAFVLAGGATAAVNGLSFSPDGERLVSGEQNISAATVWDLGTGGDAEVANLPANPSTWSDVAFTPDGQVATTSGEGSVTVWDADDRSEFRRLVPAEPGRAPDAVREITVSPDGSLLAAGGGDTGRVWDLTTGEELFDTETGGWLNRPSFSPDSRQVLFNADSGMAVLGLDGLPLAFRPAEPDTALLEAEFVPGGDLVSAVQGGHGRPSTDSRLLFWDWESDTVESWDVPIGDRHAYSPDGTLLATTTTDATVEVYDAASREHVASLGGHTSNIADMAFSPDGALVAVAGADGATALYDATTGETVLRLPRLAAEIGNIAFSRDGRRFATTSQPDNLVRIWALDPAELVAIARDKVTRSLTPAECEQYLHTPTCP